jgi:hypothetical protein
MKTKPTKAKRNRLGFITALDDYSVLNGRVIADWSVEDMNPDVAIYMEFC